MTPTYLEAIPLNYRKFGDTGPDLIVLHGLFGSGKNWGSFARSIVNDFQIWMPDTRNHGESPHAETMSYKEMAKMLFALWITSVWNESSSLVTAWVEKLQCKLHLGSEKESPESSVKMLKNYGHWLHVEQPESFQKTVSAFLQQNGLL